MKKLSVIALTIVLICVGCKKNDKEQNLNNPRFSGYIQDLSTEKGIPGLNVMIYTPSTGGGWGMVGGTMGEVYASTVTDENGCYSVHLNKDVTGKNVSIKVSGRCTSELYSYGTGCLWFPYDARAYNWETTNGVRTCVVSKENEMNFLCGYRTEKYLTVVSKHFKLDSITRTVQFANCIFGQQLTSYDLQGKNAYADHFDLLAGAPNYVTITAYAGGKKITYNTTFVPGQGEQRKDTVYLN